MDFGGEIMKVCVLGLWHLGTVTAACLASGGHEVVGLDFDSSVVQKLASGQPPLFEPGLEELVQQGLAMGRLRFSSEPAEALSGSEILWVAYDTPVDEEDRADVEFVVDRVIRLFPHLKEGMLVLISSQLPVGTTGRVERAYHDLYPGKGVTFAYSPENLRLGRAIQAFIQPDRVVAGVRSSHDRGRVEELLKPFTVKMEWMSVESAEMTKHSLNAFLATSVAFINEVACLCERVGADAKEVERGLKSDLRIGPRAYLSPGSAFAGGTLARDLRFLTQIGSVYQSPVLLLSSVLDSNEGHKLWTRRALQSLLGELRGRKVTVWGLAYKAGTDTLRRSAAVELCEWLFREGAGIQAHDPAVRDLPSALADKITLFPTPLASLGGAAALVVASEWPEFRQVSGDSVFQIMGTPLVIDPNRFLASTLGADPRVRYYTVGKACL
jgi:UDPglucose 6-dehydrogenase